MITETDLTAADKTKALHRNSVKSLLKNIKLSYVSVLVLQELVKCRAKDNDFTLAALKCRDVVVFNKLAHGEPTYFFQNAQTQITMKKEPQTALFIWQQTQFSIRVALGCKVALKCNPRSVCNRPANRNWSLQQSVYLI